MSTKDTAVRSGVDPGTGTVPERRTDTGRVASVDALKVILVSWVIGCHGLMGYLRIGGWPYDEVSEATVPPLVELVISVVLGPTSLFVIGTFFFLSGMSAPRGEDPPR